MNPSDNKVHSAEKIRLLTTVSQRIASILNLDELMVQVVQLIQQTFGYYHVGIGLIEGDEVVYRVGSGELWDSPDFGFKPARLKVGKEGITGWVAGTGSLLLIPDVTKDQRYVWMQGSQTKSELTVPIIIKGITIGVLDVQSDQPDNFSESDAEIMTALANQTGIAIENAHLYENAKKIAALEERQHLARDLHDSVTQSLYGVTLYAEVVDQLLRSGELEEARNNLKELKKMSLDALAEMRLLIYELRPSVFEQEGLIAAIQARLDAVEGRMGLQTSFVIEGEISLSRQIEETFYRITQEALNNILKHANARTTTITLSQDEHMVCLEIADDGIGFEPTQRCEAGCMGVRGMQDRARELGAVFEIISQVGSGTRVIVRRSLP